MVHLVGRADREVGEGGLVGESARLVASELREAWDGRYGRSYGLEAGHVLWMAGVIAAIGIALGVGLGVPIAFLTGI